MALFAPSLTHLFIPFQAWVCCAAFFSPPGRMWFCGSNHRTCRWYQPAPLSSLSSRRAHARRSAISEGTTAVRERAG